MFGGQGGGGGNPPPPYPFGQPPNTTAGSFGQPAPAAPAVGTFGTTGSAPGGSFGPSFTSAEGFGQTDSIFGQTSSGSSAAFGQPSAAANVMFGQQPASGTPMFGQSSTPSFGVPTASAATFGPPTAATSMSSSTAVFGQTSGLGAPVFGQTSVGAASGFGQGPGPVSGAFGQTTNSSPPVFGQGTTASSAVFGQTTTAAPPVFGRSTTAPSAVFGQTTTAASSVFGQGTTAPSAGFGQTTTASLPVFGQSTTAPPALFGQSATSPVGVDPPAAGPGPAAPAAPRAAPVPATADRPTAVIRSLFGADSAGGSSATAAPASSLFGKKQGDDVGLFGKSKQAASGQGESADAAPTSSLFGKDRGDVGLFGKPKPVTADQGESADAVSTSSLFGKDRGDVRLFGKPKKASTDKEKPAAPASSLFGKDRSAATGLFGKSQAGSAGDDGESAAAPAPAGRRAPVKSVFARPDADTPRKRLTSTTGGLAEASRRSLARTGLFGKPAEPRAAAKPPGGGPGVSGTAGPRVQRLSSAEELQEVTSLLCTEVPEGYNDRSILTRHFAKFGQVVKVSCSKAKNTASVHFADHASADAARKRGMKVHPKLPPMSLYFRRPVKSGANPSPRRPPPSDDVSDELRAMAGTDHTREPAVEQKPRRRAAPAAAVPAAAAAVVPPPAAEPAATAALNVSELRAVLRQPATTAGERYRVLDARDKLHRAAVRREQAARSGPLVGTCPDMCPEKERYMREEKHQISSLYEKDRDGQGGFEMNHRLAVKQYSRSSADQEEPLPHDLRTPAALLATMDYLVTHVTDAETRDTGDWFHFIWDRTRGIRKDITQQQLTDAVSVSLVEKCARFHVHCATSLCELSRDMFDQKINNENLTKCLQTLKHMYHDLSLKGVQCPCEAEFRAYDILLNLNQGDILREVQTYSDQVRDSPEVQSALRLYLALSTNNYVRFFKLVRRAGYLTACLLQRYFNQVRTRALDIITRTFCPPKKVVEFPLSELQHTLGFEGEQECASVLRQHGLESEEGTAFLERALFQPPDTAPELRRCHSLIDAKLDSSVGQVINGGALPADPLLSYRPHDSFDGSNVLRRSAWDARDQCQDTAETAVEAPAGPERAASPAETAAEAAAAAAARASEAAAAAVAGDMLTEVVAEEVRRHSDHLLTTVSVVQQLCGQMYQDTMRDVVAEQVREVCRTELTEAQRQQEQERRQAEERMLAQQREEARARRDQLLKERLAATLTETLVAEVCLDDTGDIAEEEMQVVMAKNSTVSELYRRLWTESADQLARETAQQVITDYRRQRDTLIQALTQIGRRLTLRRLVVRWRQTTEAGRRLRAEQSRFPAGRPLHDAQTAVRLMGGPREAPHPSADRRADQSLCSLLLSDRLFCQPVCLATVLAPLADKLSGHLLWKLAVAAPPACPLTQWLLHKLSDDQQRPDDVLQLSSVAVSPRCRLSLCARALRGRPGEAVGSAGLALAFSGRQTAGRLRALLAGLPREPLLPLAVLAPPGRRQEVLDQLHLPDRLRDGAVTTYRVFELETEDAVRSGETLVAMLEWLFDHRPAVPPLRSGVTRHVAEDFLGEQVTRRMYSDLHMRRNMKRVEQCPTACISLYNTAVRHLATVLSSSSLPGLSWPPAELAGQEDVPPEGWNRPARLLRLQQSVEELSLPCLELDPDWSWSDSCAEVLQYVRGLTETGHDCTPTLYRVQSLLRERLRQLRQAAWPLDDDVMSQPLAASLPWTDIVQCCIELRTCRLSTTETVYYLPDEMANFRVPDVWADLTSMPHTNECLTLDESVTIAKRPLDTSLEDSSSKRRPEKSSFLHPTLDVSTGITREMNVSLDWEVRLRELVDQGDGCSGVPGPLSSPDSLARSPLPSPGRLARSPLPSPGRLARSPLPSAPLARSPLPSLGRPARSPLPSPGLPARSPLPSLGRPARSPLPSPGRPARSPLPSAPLARSPLPSRLRAGSTGGLRLLERRASLERRLDELRADLSADRHHSDDFSRRLLAAGAELATVDAGGETS